MGYEIDTAPAGLGCDKTGVPSRGCARRSQGGSTPDQLCVETRPRYGRDPSARKQKCAGRMIVRTCHFAPPVFTAWVGVWWKVARRHGKPESLKV